MASGGAGYDMLRTKRFGHYPGTVKDTEAIIKYIQSKTPIFVETGNRLHIKTQSSNVGSFSINLHVLFPLQLFYPILSISLLAEF